MKKRILPLLAALLALTGCTSLLERSYNVVEPYTNRYWDTGAEDTLRAESYQDLVNSLLMLVEERSEEGTIRYYAEHNADAYQLALNAKKEVLGDTVLGSYLLDDITFTFSSGETYASMTYTIHYRAAASDPNNLMALSDTQSLVDLMRLAVRENHDMLTARFINPVDRVAVESAVESLWQELCLSEMEVESGTEPGETGGKGEDTPADEPPEEAPSGKTEETAPAAQPDTGNTPDAENTSQPDEGGGEEEPAPPAIEYPPCPWQIIFYPGPDSAEIVEILLD